MLIRGDLAVLSDSLGDIRVSSARAPILAYDTLGLIAFAADSAGLAAASVVVSNVFCYAINGHASDAAETLQIAATPIALLLAQLWFDGAYRPDVVTEGELVASRVVRYWCRALLFFACVFLLLKSAAEIDAWRFSAIAVAIPGILLVQRRAITHWSRLVLKLGYCRFPNAFVILEDNESSPETAEIVPGRRIFLLSSFAQPDPARLGQLIASIRTADADEVRLVSKTGSLKYCQLLLDELRKIHLPVKFVANDADADLLRCPITRTGIEFAFEIQRAPLTPVERMLKRAFDVSVAALLLTSLSPLMASAAFAIAFTSPGPIMFRQTRNGFNGRPFTIYKFRTMTVEENGSDVAQAVRNDPRVTRIGRLLRRTSIDELPQLLNVIWGDMSLIGPRPHAVAHDDAFAALIASYAARHRVKPGITGLAQVCGHRGEMKTPEAISRRVEFDLSYIERWSLWLDLWITFRTIVAIIVPRNAY